MLFRQTPENSHIRPFRPEYSWPFLRVVRNGQMAPRSCFWRRVDISFAIIEYIFNILFLFKVYDGVRARPSGAGIVSGHIGSGGIKRVPAHGDRLRWYSMLTQSLPVMEYKKRYVRSSSVSPTPILYPGDVSRQISFACVSVCTRSSKSSVPFICRRMRVVDSRLHPYWSNPALYRVARHSLDLGPHVALRRGPGNSFHMAFTFSSPPS